MLPVAILSLIKNLCKQKSFSLLTCQTISLDVSFLVVSCKCMVHRLCLHHLPSYRRCTVTQSTSASHRRAALHQDGVCSGSCFLCTRFNLYLRSTFSIDHISGGKWDENAGCLLAALTARNLILSEPDQSGSSWLNTYTTQINITLYIVSNRPTDLLICC